MQGEKTINLLRERLEKHRKLLDKRVFESSVDYHYYFHEWRAETEYALSQLFGEDSKELKRFRNAARLPRLKGTRAQLNVHRYKSMMRAKAELKALISSIEEYGISEKQEGAISRNAFIARGKQIDKKRIDEKRAIELLKQALNEISRLKELRNDKQEFILWFDKVRGIIQAGLDEDDRQRFPSSLEVTITTGGDLPSDDDFQKLYLIQLQSCETALRSIIQKYEILEETTSTSKTSREAVYPSDLPYDAYKDIKAIISLATNKLIVVDPYVDSTVVTLLENVQPGVEIQVLTRKMQGDFQLAGQKFKDQREKAKQGTLEVRKSGKLHDRFVFADDKSFHLGASVKDAGTKMCAMSEFEDSDIKSKLNETISGYWAEAEIVL